MHDNKKILVVGQFSKNPDVYCYTDSFIKILKQLGFAVEIFPYYPVVQKNLLHRLYALLYRYFINMKLFLLCFIVKPEYLFVLKGEVLHAKAIALIKKISSLQVIWFYPDSPFIFWNGNSNAHMLKVLPYVDLYLSWSKQLMPLLEHAGASTVRYFPFGYDKDIFVRDVLHENVCHEVCEDDYRVDVLFIGTWSAEREIWFSELVRRMPDLNLAIFGTGWMERRSMSYPLAGYLYGDAKHAQYLPHFFSTAKININFLRPQNFDAHNMRSIEVPATGNFLLAQRSKEHAIELFKENESIACFSDMDELVQKIEYYLSHEKERLAIAQKGYEQAQKYSLDILLHSLFKEKGASGL